MGTGRIRIGSRGSSLALVQTRMVIDALKQKYPEYEYEITVIRTAGDKILDKPLPEFGGKGVFVTEFEDALLSGAIDLAVHSAKDMPADLKEELAILGVLKREDPRDVLITLQSADITGKEKAVIGTSSLRRQVQIQALYGNIQCSPLRGNVATRLDKLSGGSFDGIILAAAGIKRLKLEQEPRYSYRYLEIDELVPAGGQAIIAIEGKRDSKLRSMLESISDPYAGIELAAERRALELFHAGCHEPIGVFTKVMGDEIGIWMMKEQDGKLVKREGSTALDKRYLLLEDMVNGILEEF